MIDFTGFLSKKKGGTHQQSSDLTVGDCVMDNLDMIKETSKDEVRFPEVSQGT